MTFKPDPKPAPKKKKEAKRIRKVSKSRKSEKTLYLIARELYINQHPICERCNRKHSDQIHHKGGRIGSLLYDKRYFLAVCDTCHKWIEANPKLSKEEGWSISRLSK